MKKSSLIVIGILVVLALIVVIVLSGSPAENPNDPNKPSAPPDGHIIDDPENPEKNPGDDDTEPVDQPEPEPEPEVIPEPTAEDIQNSILSTDDETDKKFLTKAQKKELNSPSLSKTNPKPRADKTFTVTWADSDFAASIPALPTEVPLYLLDRPKTETIYDFLRQLGNNLSIKGAVIRMSEQSFTIANITTGDFFLNYDLYHLLYEANDLAVPLNGAGAQGVENTLGAVGLLGFPYRTEEHEDDFGNTWYRFVPDLQLDAFALNGGVQDDTFIPGAAGVVDVAVNADKITDIIAGFPNIEEKGSVKLADTDDLSNLLNKGTFKLGDAELQYPGALKVEDKRAFYDMINQTDVAISEAEVSAIECGYFLENDETVQVILAPSCIISGKGKVQNYSVLFDVVAPIAK